MKLSLRQLATDAVIEEGAEVTQVLMKIDRFGLYSRNPYLPDEPSNLMELAKEMGDLYGALDMMLREFPEIDEAIVNEHRRTKREKLIKHNDGEKADMPFVFRDDKLFTHDGRCLGEITINGFIPNNTPMTITAD